MCMHMFLRGLIVNTWIVINLLKTVIIVLMFNNCMDNSITRGFISQQVNMLGKFTFF